MSSDGLSFHFMLVASSNGWVGLNGHIMLRPLHPSLIVLLLMVLAVLLLLRPVAGLLLVVLEVRLVIVGIRVPLIITRLVSSKRMVVALTLHSCDLRLLTVHFARPVVVLPPRLLSIRIAVVIGLLPH